MLHFSRFKTTLILGLCLFGVLLSIPNLLPHGSLPAWVPQPRVNLGLDLQGGSYLLLEVDMNSVIKERIASTRSTVAETLRKAKVPFTSIVAGKDSVSVTFADETQLGVGRQALNDILRERVDGPAHALVFSPKTDGNTLNLTLNPEAVTDLSSKAVQQSISIVRRRIDETGVNEPVVARQGQNRVLVELPGVSDPDRIKRLLGSTAKMTFRLVAPEGTPAGPDVELLPMANKAEGTPKLAVRRHVEVDGMNLTRATAALDQRAGGWVVDFGLDSIGTRRFADVSTKHVGQPFAIVLDNKVISAPVIREPIIGGQGQISGNFTVEEANDLAVLLRAGALPAPLTIVEERSIGPSLGADAIRAGLYSIIAGFIFVVGFMLTTYGRFGLFAAVALVVNLALTIAGLSMMGATLTLPGMAGILLALGMAVDANILINERTREELGKRNGVIASIETGFRRAYTTIMDANLTTLIKMLILFVVGVGAIRGFAVTISLGIIVSIFTAIVLVRLLTAWWLQRTRPKTLTIGTRFRFFPDHTAIAFMRARYSGLIVSALISLASIGLAFHPGLKMGIDFAGGVVIEAKTPAPADAPALQSALMDAGLGPVQVQRFGAPDDVLLRFEHPEGTTEQQQAALQHAKEAVEKAAPGAEIRRVEVVGPSIGAELLNDGIWALGLAAIAMFAYITFRFEWPFAVGAIVTMFLDLTKTVGFLALTGFEFNMTSIAAILTIMGFSINDKVVVYDRVRENLVRSKRVPLREVIDRSINETLSRTIGTSIALFLAIAPLALFGGPALREFALTLLFGLVLATSSSIFIAAPILLNIGEHYLRRGGPVAEATPEPARGKLKGA
ncbi:protein translocase subunit SecD [Hyphomicrobium sp.]|uniref:protein translocase subunit SecD n=1 Tax=Hyphomicrobium sp. TaxID=82 RepID=UPI002E35D5D6|nr:protein translocase subunit SecD [Hyphomicrobium sp.]HEX2841818.1 protein translocase subunit SecD [Hyphomicrobium sp.]